MKEQQSIQHNRLVLSRVFNAPKELVFSAFSTSEALNEWWGPTESENTVISLEFSPGGIFHFKMNFQGNIMYGRFHYRKIKPHDYIEFTNSFADEQANVVPAPFDKNFPLEVLYRLEFIEEVKGKTTLVLTGEPLNQMQGELDAFNSLIPSMNEGFSKTWDKLQSYLERSL